MNNPYNRSPLEEDGPPPIVDQHGGFYNKGSEGAFWPYIILVVCIVAFVFAVVNVMMPDVIPNLWDDIQSEAEDIAV